MKYWLASLCLIAPLLQAEINVRDDAGQTIRLPQAATRIVSLAPHLTEDLFAIGAGERIVGAVSYSDYPAAAQKIPRIGGYNRFDLERIRALKPDLIVAWASGNPPQQLELIKRLGIPVFLDDARQLADVPTILERLGTLTGQLGQAQNAARHFRARIAALETKHGGQKPVRVFYQVWDRPLMTINKEQIISDALRVCGASNVFAAQATLTPIVDEEAVLAAQPEMIITSGETGAPGEKLARWRRFGQIPAVARKQLVTLPADLLIRMGPRLADGTEALCNAIAKARQP